MVVASGRQRFPQVGRILPFARFTVVWFFAFRWSHGFVTGCRSGLSLPTFQPCSEIPWIRCRSPVTTTQATSPTGRGRLLTLSEDLLDWLPAEIRIFRPLAIRSPGICGYSFYVAGFPDSPPRFGVATCFEWRLLCFSGISRNRVSDSLRRARCARERLRIGRNRWNFWVSQP